MNTEQQKGHTKDSALIEEIDACFKDKLATEEFENFLMRIRQFTSEDLICFLKNFDLAKR